MITSSNNTWVVGVDLGGTKIKAGLICGDQLKKTAKSNLPEDKDVNSESVIDTIIKTIEDVFTKSVKGIGIGVPSVLDRKNGIIYDVQNIKSWKEVPLQKILENKFGVPVCLDNDANCFAIGEKLFGKGKSFQNFVGITIGTGIGGGIINKGTLLADENCGSGEFGEIYYLDGRIEDYCSAQFFDNKIGISGAELFKRAQDNDKYSLSVFKQFGRHLGKALKIIMFAVDPEAIIIGGTISCSRKYFEPSMHEELQTFTYKKSLENLKIIFSEINDDTQIFGSAAVYLTSNRCRS